MSTAVLLAVKTFAESSSVLKHAFTFLSYVSNETLTLDVVVSYVLRFDKSQDEEDTRFRILQCSLILFSEYDEIVSISLHRVVHDSLKLYHDTGHDKKITVAFVFDMFQLLIQNKCALCIKPLIPHFRTFSERTDNLKDIVVPDLIHNKHEILINTVRLSLMLIKCREFLLSKTYLILAVKIAKNESDEDNLGLLYVSFPSIGAIYFNLAMVEGRLENIAQARNYSQLALEVLLKQRKFAHKSLEQRNENLLNLSLTCLDLKECTEFEIEYKVNFEEEKSGLPYAYKKPPTYKGTFFSRKVDKNYRLSFTIFYELSNTNPKCTLWTLTMSMKNKQVKIMS
ncbi:Hypothetical predicted protein [Paramuricea clavata]|uniref:Uncharacterized protein n=1 Tax=Paramuricea clavata TaxID=317549 RepID=A0A7D9J6M3_PARCT|nr:Hypothetical predicted protein [Paramuricea clavata]